MSFFPVTTVLLCFLSVGACVSTDYGTRAAGERPDDLRSSEASFWYQMDAFERAFKASGAVLDNAALQTFLSEMTCTIARDYCDDLRVYIVRNPSFNASMAPNGMMLVHTGLLLRVSDESELAAVLAHEFVHYEENHSLENYAAMKNASRSVAFMSGFGLVGQVGMIVVAGGMTGFMQDQETQADVKGLIYMGEAGYNTGSAVAVWDNLSKEFSASSDVTKERRALKGRFLATHPGLAERMQNLQNRAAAFPRVPTNPGAYRALIRPFLKEWLDSEAMKNDPGSTLHLIDRLEALGQDLGVLHYARGRVYALRGEAGDDAQAITAYKTAVLYADVPVECYRDLGEIYRKTGRLQQAFAAYRKYLDSTPGVRDAALIERHIEKIKEASS